MNKQNIYFHFLLSLSLLYTGCATINLNDKTLNQSTIPDPIIFADPICINAEFKWNDSGQITQMDKQQISQLTSGFLYYNIFLNCEHPAGVYTITYHTKNRNSVIDSIWKTSFYITLGIIPYYSNENGSITIEENGHILSKTNYQIKKIGSLLIFPLVFTDDIISIHKYRTNADRAMKSRFLATAIKSSIESKALKKSLVR